MSADLEWRLVDAPAAPDRYTSRGIEEELQGIWLSICYIDLTMCIHTHTRAHTYTHTCIHTYIYIHTHTHTHTRMHAHTHTHMAEFIVRNATWEAGEYKLCTYMYMWTYISIYIYTSILVCMHIIHAYLCVHVCTCACAYAPVQRLRQKRRTCCHCTNCSAVPTAW
jgi:hypothetical protein